MATGDADDIRERIGATLPRNWFGTDVPLRQAVLGGLADALAWVFAFITYARTQTRLATASEFWLDLYAWDAFGVRFQRRERETDDGFRARIKAELLRPRATRAAIRRALREATGFDPVLIEPWNAADIRGGYGAGRLGYGVAGRYASLRYPYQMFARVRRPTPGNLPGLGGYDLGRGGYGAGRIAYVGRAVAAPSIPDADIYQTIEQTKTAGTCVWTKIGSGDPSGPLPQPLRRPPYFVLA